MFNMDILRNPQNWLRVWLMLALGFVTIFLVMHFLAPRSVEPVN